MLYPKPVPRRHLCQADNAWGRFSDDTKILHECKVCHGDILKCITCKFDQIWGRLEGGKGKFKCIECGYIHLDYATMRDYGKFNGLVLTRTLR